MAIILLSIKVHRLQRLYKIYIEKLEHTQGVSFIRDVHRKGKRVVGGGFFFKLIISTFLHILSNILRLIFVQNELRIASFIVLNLLVLYFVLQLF